MLNVRFKQGTNMSDHDTCLEYQFLRLRPVGSIVEDTMKVSIIISLFTEWNKYPSVGACVNTMQKEIVARNYVATVFTVQSKQRISTS